MIVWAPVVARVFEPKGKNIHADLVPITPEQLVPTLVGVWLALLLYGTYRMEGDIFATLFPLAGRSDSTMWQRAAGEAAGPAGFIVSAAAYLYSLVLSPFGLLLPVPPNASTRSGRVACILISWPSAL